MRAKTLLDEGAKVISPLEFYRSRPKAYGYMWGGKLILEKDGNTYHFGMWHHGGDQMTEDEALDSISLEGITYQGQYYDAYWFTVMTEDEIYLHQAGWFGNKDLEREVVEVLGGNKSNYSFARDTLNDRQREELLDMGFIKIASAERTNFFPPSPGDLLNKIRRNLPKLP